ncbi:MAG TPA: DUF3168 domain-containing protein [Planctomycetota bacterium]|nr:DUF3168 domain-containing protein [Planctomycetota bacterium]
MSFETDLVSHLRAQIALNALVEDRIHPGLLPQEAVLPALTYFTVSSERPSSQGGYSGLATIRLQVSAWSTLYSEVLEAIRLVRLALQNRTPLGVGLLLGEHDFYEPDVKYYQRAFEIYIERKEVD